MSLSAAELEERIRHEPTALLSMGPRKWIRFMPWGKGDRSGTGRYDTFEPPYAAARFAHKDVVAALSASPPVDPATVSDGYRMLFASVDEKTALAEVFVRNAEAPRTISREQIRRRDFVELRTPQDFLVFDLSDPDLCLRLRLDTDAIKAADHTASYELGTAIHGLKARPLGIVFPSRLRGQLNIAFFERAWKPMRLVTELDRFALHEVMVEEELEALGIGLTD